MSPEDLAASGFQAAEDGRRGPEALQLPARAVTGATSPLGGAAPTVGSRGRSGAGAIPGGDLEAFLARPDHALRERLLWRMLYETAARAQEVLLLDVEDLDLPNRRAVVIGKGGDAEPIVWETAAAALLPRYLARRSTGPLFLADVDAASGRGRLSYRRAAHLFAVATEGRWTLHQLRHSRLTAWLAGRR